MYSFHFYRMRLLSVALLAAATLAVGNSARAQRDDIYKNGPKVLAAYRQVVAKPSESTVRVRCDGKDAAYGTIIQADGYILTKASELKAPIVCKLKDGRDLDAKIVGVQEKYDLAMLKVNASDLKPIDWRKSTEAQLGAFVASPGLSENPVAVGVVSVATREGYNGFVPDPKSGFLGVQMAKSETDPAVIEDVLPNTAAEKAGLKKGDVILSIEGAKIKDQLAARQKLGKYKPNDEVTLKVKRGDEQLELKAKLGRRPREDNIELMGPISERNYGFPIFLEHDTVLKPSDCGGPLVDLDGKALGINIARAGRYESYAIPSENVQPLIADLISGKLAPKVADKLKDLREAIAKMEDKRDALIKKMAEATEVMKSSEKEKAEVEKKLAEARESLKKLETENTEDTQSKDKDE